MTSQELYECLKPAKTKTVVGQILTDGVSVNLSDFYTRLIKDAARCNNYSSDVVYDIDVVNDLLKNYKKPFEPYWFGFRRHGVDNTSLLLIRIEGDPYRVYSLYFALYSLTIENIGDGFVKITENEYAM